MSVGVAELPGAFFLAFADLPTVDDDIVLAAGAVNLDRPESEVFKMHVGLRAGRKNLYLSRLR